MISRLIGKDPGYCQYTFSFLSDIPATIEWTRPSRSVRLDALRPWITSLHHALAWLDMATAAERPEPAEAILAA